MARRTTVFQQIPWTGGVNTAVDSGILPPNDLVQADNVVFNNGGSRLKREGFDYFDDYELPLVVSRSSTGTTRTLTFADLVDADATIHVGEQITVSGINNSYNTEVGTVLSVSGDEVEYTFAGAASLTEPTTATTAQLGRNYNIIATHDYWYFDSANNQKQQLLVAVSSQGFVYVIQQGGVRQVLTPDVGATPLVAPIEFADMRTYSNKTVITFSGIDNTPKYFDAMNASPLTLFELSDAPNGEYMQEWLGRLWMNDKLDRDYLHYCETFDETKWLGVGDSGAIYIGIEDGDPVGISAIFPPFKGSLFIGKGEKIGYISGDAPENWSYQAISNGLGAVSHKSVVARDFDDVYYVSRRGIHSVLATNATGDYEGNFLSAKIQNTFNSWNKQNLKLSQATYIEPINTVFWAVSEEGQTNLSSLWAFNPSVNQGEWHRWPDLNPRSVGKRLQDQETRIIVGTSDGRILIGQNKRYDDNGSPYTYRVKTGTIYPDNNPQTIKGFKRFSLLFRQKGRFSFQAYFKIDNQPAQAFTFTQTLEGDMLGVDFVTGQSILGSEVVMAPITKQVLGYGRGCTVELAQTGAEAQVEVYGLLIEYEGADIADEVKEGN